MNSLSSFVSNNKELLTISATIFVALLGFLLKYINDLAIARRKDRLDRINTQLRLLYGPLFALTQASASVWRQFRLEFRPGIPYFDNSNPPSEAERLIWNLWMRFAFMPMNRRMVDVIIANGDLLEGDMPREFLSLVAHVTEYETLLQRWEKGDFTKYVAAIPFPREIERIVKEEYERLQAIQRSLLANKDSRQRRPAG